MPETGSPVIARWWNRRLAWRLGCAASIVVAGCEACSSNSTDSDSPPELTGISVTPATFSIGVGLNRQLVATATYDDGSTTNRAAEAVWSTTSSGVATVNAGLVVGVGTGTCRIIVEYGLFADTSEVTVTSTLPVQVGLRVTPESRSIGLGGTAPFVATAVFNDSSTQVVTGQATWNSSNLLIATVNLGLVTGIVGGSAEIRAAFGGFADTAQLTVTSVPGLPYRYPLVMGPTGRYLVDQDGKPFFLVGDAAWSLVSQLTDADADLYLAARQQQGFNFVIVNLIEHKFATNAPADIYNLDPFTGDPFVAPNEAYFAHADHIIQSAEDKGIVVLLAPTYGGWGCSDEGWCADMQRASTATMKDWGRYVGTRYRNYDNIVWVLGGDVDPGTVSLKPKLTAVVEGIQETDTRHLFTAHGASEQLATSQWAGASWLQINNVYTYGQTLYQMALSAYHVTPAIPFWLVESSYENDLHGQSQQELRAQSYWTALSGGFGHTYGACPMWHFSSSTDGEFCPNTDWKDQLQSQGAKNMQYYGRLFASRHWHLLVPDETHVAVTSGLGSGSGFVTAAAASDGSSIIAYLPSSRAVTVNGASLAGTTMTARWYNPSNGTSTSLGSVTKGTQTYTPPGAGDWVLLVDSDSFGFGAP